MSTEHPVNPEHPVQVDTGFPGGNAVIERVEADRIVLRPDLRDTIGDWFYWCIRVRGATGRDLTVQVRRDGGPGIGVRGPAVSTDGGNHWTWLGADSVSGDEFTLSVPDDASELRLSFGMSYTAEHLERFLTANAAHGGLERGLLTHSEHGRPVDRLRLGNLQGSPHRRVLLTGRHHACEMMASHVLEGLLAHVLGGDDEEARWLAGHVELVVVPFVDVDGVARGDQGKNRAPHDHARDYGPEGGLYPETRAITQLLDDTGRFDAVLDLHCPNVAGPTSQRAYFVGSEGAENWEAVQRLAAALEEETATGPLEYRRADNLPFGTAWNGPANYLSRDGLKTPLTSLDAFCADRGDIGTHAVLEFPYADAHGAEVNAVSARAFGAALARALARHLAGSGAGQG
ncbi:M14 family zinc carboxypeptidase [Brachybacterium tyrofermentans]|uniref:M14 family zinc carboxypeptidase n=1 Tax=Brachybacterium tyrofermentans TaxID=47848 RepID=UPI003FD01162